MFLPTAKDMWDTLKVIYRNEKNPFRVFKIYEHLFELKQGDRLVPEFYGEVKGLIDELGMHQLSVTNTVTLKGYHQDLTVSEFLSSLTPTSTATFSRVMRVSTGADIFSAPSIEQSVMIFGREFIGGGRDSHGGRQNASEKGPR